MFYSESLNQSFHELTSRAADLTGRLDNISADIKNVEEKLRELGIGFAVSAKVLIRQKLEAPEVAMVEASGLDDCVEEFFADETLSWQKCEASGNFRVFYTRQLGCEDPPLLGHFGVRAQLVHKPLIETPAPVRLRVSDHLSKLVDAVVEKLS